MLRTFGEADSPDLILAVNRAPVIAWNAWRRAVDWWVFGNWDIYGVHRKLLPYQPRIFTHATSRHRLTELGRWDSATAGGAVMYESLFAKWPASRGGPMQGWSNYSATAALILAADLGATCINVHGADWTDEPDADGQRMPDARRTERRWSVERKIWTKLCGALAAEGIHVERIGVNHGE